MTAVALRFVVPWSALCSDNRKYVNGRFVLTPAYRASKDAIARYANTAATRHKWAMPTGAVALRVTVCEPDRRKRDLNWSKNLKDGISFAGNVWWDDCQVRDEHWRFEARDAAATWLDNANEGGALVEIWMLDAAPVTPKRRRKSVALSSSAP